MSQSIWNHSSEDIQNIFNWFKENNGKYDFLLSPVTLSISFQNIKGNIQLFQEYGIDSYLKPACLRKSVKVQRLILEYMKKNNIPFLINNDKNTFQLNPILCATASTLKEKYGIDVKKLKNANRGTFLK